MAKKAMVLQEAIYAAQKQLDHVDVLDKHRRECIRHVKQQVLLFYMCQQTESAIRVSKIANQRCKGIFLNFISY